MAYLEPILGGLAAFLLGFAWYTALFGKAWQAETGVTDEQAQQGMGITHGGALLMMIIISFGINTFRAGKTMIHSYGVSSCSKPGMRNIFSNHISDTLRFFLIPIFPLQNITN